MSCYSCSQEALAERPPREEVAVDAHWRLAHAIGTSLPGWLVLVPRRHVLTTAELSDDEAASLGPWLVRASRALQAVTGCAKTYQLQFSDHPEYPHLHWHLVPRAADLDPALRGPNVFAFMQGDPVDDAAMDDVALRLRAALP